MVRFVVNGRDVAVEADTTLLLYALRNDLGLYGVRTGCAVGECGACVVLVDGRAERSCQVPVSAVDGARVTTPEGLGTPADPHPIQRAFLDEQAAQCGYCVNGIIMSLAGLLAADPSPGEAAIQAALAEHLCRCGAHHRILRAARRLAGHDVPPPEPIRTAAAAAPPAAETGATGPRAAAPSTPAAGAPETAATGPLPEPAPVAAETAATKPLPAPNVEDWLRPLDDGTIEVLTGRVELGQGIRTALAQIVAAELGMPVDRITVRSAQTGTAPDEGYTAGSMSLEHGGTALARAAAAYRRLTEAGQAPVGPIQDTDRPQWTSGDSAPREDLTRKLTGAAAYLHDLVLPGMLHARALLPPTPVHTGQTLLVVAPREEDAIHTVDQFRRAARWSTPDPEPPPDDDPTAYIKPYEAHAAVAPSCAVALEENGHLTVWTHSQGVYPLRRELAALFGEDESRITVSHMDGPGCYGHNGADDAAGFAAVAARAVPGRPVRFQFSMRDEFAWEPYGPAMRAELSATLTSGRIDTWRARIITGPHTSRPHGSGDRLAVAWLRAGGTPIPWTGGGEGGLRNAVPLYDIPDCTVDADHVRTKTRTSALRSLGAYLNVFAIESYMDELAEAAGADPVAFRLSHLRDERAREVLRTAAAAVAWRSREGPTGRGRGIALARYKGSKAYVAQVVDVHVDTTTARVTVHRVLTVCDAGTVINPDGLRNQLEGGTLQGLSRALHERAPATGWTDYPVLRFAEVPRLDTILLDRPGLPPLGAGEAATPVTPAALANAVDDAVGIRVRGLPLTPERILARLEGMDEREGARVRA